MNIEDLEKFGMTKVEAQVYNELLFLGESKIGDIIRRTGLHRGTVYNALNSLVEKGFLSSTKKKDITYFSVNMAVFKEIIDAESGKIKYLEKIYHTIQNLKKIPADKKKTDVVVFYGDKSFKAFFNDLYDWAERENKEYFFMGRGQEMINHFGEDYYRQTQDLKRHRGIRCRVILNEVARKESVNHIVCGNVKYLNWMYLSPGSIWLYDTSVVIVLWEPNPMITIMIRSKEAYDSHLSFFEALWKTANP